MTAARVAQLYRRRADLLREVADVDAEIAAALEDDAPAREPAKRRHAPSPTGEVEIDDVTRARARRLMRRSGLVPR